MGQPQELLGVTVSISQPTLIKFNFLNLSTPVECHTELILTRGPKKEEQIKQNLLGKSSLVPLFISSARPLV